MPSWKRCAPASRAPSSGRGMGRLCVHARSQRGIPPGVCVSLCSYGALLRYASLAHSLAGRGWYGSNNGTIRGHSGANATILHKSADIRAAWHANARMLRRMVESTPPGTPLKRFNRLAGHRSPAWRTEGVRGGIRGTEWDGAAHLGDSVGHFGEPPSGGWGDLGREGEGNTRPAGGRHQPFWPGILRKLHPRGTRNACTIQMVHYVPP